MRKHLSQLTKTVLATGLLFGTLSASIAGETKKYSLVEKVLGLHSKKDLPVCNDVKVLKSISSKFNHAEKETWQRGFEMATVGGINERRYDGREDIYGEPPLRPTRYCEGSASMSNGSSYSLHYIVTANDGYAGIKWGTEFCLHGLEPWKVYNGHCQILH